MTRKYGFCYLCAKVGSLYKHKIERGGIKIEIEICINCRRDFDKRSLSYDCSLIKSFLIKEVFQNEKKK